MSRIEEALEKALKVRPQERAAAKETPAVERVSDMPKFEFSGGAVDVSGVDRHIVTITEPRSSVAEQYSKLRARILRATAKDSHNTIMVTSSDTGEGKTITAINLAVSIANELDHTALLIDADLRRPSVHQYLGLSPSSGLSDYLMDKADLSDVLIKTGIGKLVLLPAGNPPQNPSELISSDRMRSFVSEVKGRYKDRYIIFDSSPLLLTAEPISLSNYVDGTLFVVQADRTVPKAATQALSLLKGCPVLGVVFNNVPQYLAKRVYQYNYRYGAYNEKP
jgi:protein-tyrosine kinase